MTIYICKLCVPNDAPEITPSVCRILVCPIHGRAWHWPADEDPPRVPSKQGGGPCGRDTALCVYY